MDERKKLQEFKLLYFAKRKAEFSAAKRARKNGTNQPPVSQWQRKST